MEPDRLPDKPLTRYRAKKKRGLKTLESSEAIPAAPAGDAAAASMVGVQGELRYSDLPETAPPVSAAAVFWPEKSSPDLQSSPELRLSPIPPALGSDLPEKTTIATATTVESPETSLPEKRDSPEEHFSPVLNAPGSSQPHHTAVFGMVDRKILQADPSPDVAQAAPAAIPTSAVGGSVKEDGDATDSKTATEDDLPVERSKSEQSNDFRGSQTVGSGPDSSSPAPILVLESNYDADDKHKTLPELHGEKKNEPVTKKPVSFADLLKNSSNFRSGKGKLVYYPPEISELGTRRAVIPDDLVLKQASDWALTLTGYFIGKRPAFPFVQYHCRRMWKKFGLTDVILNDQGFFFFKFNSDEGLNFVFENGPWLFNGMPIFIQRWQHGLCFDKPEPNLVPLWVNIYGLPLDVWDLDILSYIASVVGVPMAVDRYTEDMCETKSGRANFARILVNASADFELPSEIDTVILGKLRKFKAEFPWKPKRCSHCKVFGHDLDGCLVGARPLDALKHDKPIASGTYVGESSKNTEEGFRFPKRRRPRPKHKKVTLKVDPKLIIPPNPLVASDNGIKLNQRSVPFRPAPNIDPSDKGKGKIDVIPPLMEMNNLPVKVSNQFTVIEEDEEWLADKKMIDCFIDQRGKGLEPSVVNEWNTTKLNYFVSQWERVYGKEPDGSLRGFCLPIREIISDDDNSDNDDTDVESLGEEQWLEDKKVIDNFIAHKGNGLNESVIDSWNDKTFHYFFTQWERLHGADDNGTLRGCIIQDGVLVHKDDVVS